MQGSQMAPFLLPKQNFQDVAQFGRASALGAEGFVSSNLTILTIL